MSKVTITGASDDLIELDGDISEEFSAYGEEDGSLLAFSNGTVLRVVYNKDGIWRVTRVASGTAAFTKIEGDITTDTFDVATLEGDIRWVVRGREMVTARKSA